MRTHLARLPEYYPSREEDLAATDWLKKFYSISNFPRERVPKGLKKMGHKRILIVDDELKFRETYRRLLISLGHDVMTSSHAAQAKDFMIKYRFDIVLLDINMGEVDGGVLYDLIRAFHKDVKVVVSSVYSIDEQKEKIKNADGYFDKSDDKDVLITLISSFLDKKV